MKYIDSRRFILHGRWNNSIKDKLIALIEHTFTREKTLYLAYNEEHVSFTSDVYKNYGPAKTFVKPLFIFWILFSLDLELNFIDKL